MYIEHPAYSKPEDENMSIWRYMSVVRYAELLERSALYFCRLDKLANDPFEGAVPMANLDESERRLAAVGREQGVTDAAIRDGLVEWRKQTVRMFSQQRRNTAVNCWHMGAHESEAMWRLYSTKNAGVAVCSSFTRLRDSFSATKEAVRIGTVQYVEDYRVNVVPGAALELPVVLKRTSFEHEAELRAAIQKPARLSTEMGIEFEGRPWRHGKHVRVELDVLIDKVFVRPGSSKYLARVIEAVNEKYSRSYPVVRSELLDKPRY